MKILAIEHEEKNCNWSEMNEILAHEASVVHDYYLEGFIREMHFNENKNAVLILESQSIDSAHELLGELPLVKHGMIRFELMVLKPYTGFARILSH